MAANDRHQVPPGWRVDEKQRTNGKYSGKIDKFYYEPGTNIKYRSLRTARARHEESNQQRPEVIVEEGHPGFERQRVGEGSMVQILKSNDDVQLTNGVQYLPLVGQLRDGKCEKRQRHSLERYDKALEAPEAASFKRKRPLPISSGSTKGNKKKVEIFLREALHNQLNYGTKNKDFRSSIHDQMDCKVQNSTFFTVERVTEFLERDQERRMGENLQQREKRKEKGKGKEMESPSWEEVTPRLTPVRGSDQCLRRLNNEEYNVPQGNKENPRNERSEVGGESITRLSDKTEQEKKGKTIIPDLNIIPDEDIEQEKKGKTTIPDLNIPEFGSVNNNEYV